MPEDVVTGVWEVEMRTFEADDSYPDAVLVRLRLSFARGNPGAGELPADHRPKRPRS